MTTLSDLEIASYDDVLAHLDANVAGRLLLPGTPEYAALATPWNVAVPTAPLAVVEVVSAADVVATVRLAAEHGLEVVVQRTGHGAWRYDKPTILVHTHLLDELVIDPSGRARVGAGVLWQQLLDAAAPYGLAGLSGSSPHVGVVGYLTGGGLSPVGRTFGYASDYVTAFDVVTGDGELRRATADENPALFWALRGGKGALGIVTAVELDLLPVREIFGGALFFDGSDAHTVLQAWREWSATLPSAASTSVAILQLPQLPMVPPPLAGRVTVAVRFAYVGDEADGAAMVAPMAEVAPVILGGMGVMPFAAIGAIHADPVDPMPVTEASALLRELTPEAVNSLVAAAGVGSDSPQVIVELRLLGGALADQPRHASAVSHRDAGFALLAIGIAAPPVVDATVAHAQRLLAALQPWGDGVTQPNFAASSDPAVVARSYDRATLTRLATLAATYDPRGVIAASHAVRTACLTGC